MPAYRPAGWQSRQRAVRSAQRVGLVREAGRREAGLPVTLLATRESDVGMQRIGDARRVLLVAEGTVGRDALVGADAVAILAAGGAVRSAQRVTHARVAETRGKPVVLVVAAAALSSQRVVVSVVLEMALLALGAEPLQPAVPGVTARAGNLLVPALQPEGPGLVPRPLDLLEADRAVTAAAPLSVSALVRVPVAPVALATGHGKEPVDRRRLESRRPPRFGQGRALLRHAVAETAGCLPVLAGAGEAGHPLVIEARRSSLGRVALLALLAQPAPVRIALGVAGVAAQRLEPVAVVQVALLAFDFSMLAHQRKAGMALAADRRFGKTHPGGMAAAAVGTELPGVRVLVAIGTGALAGTVDPALVALAAPVLLAQPRVIAGQGEARIAVVVELSGCCPAFRVTAGATLVGELGRVALAPGVAAQAPGVGPVGEVREGRGQLLSLSMTAGAGELRVPASQGKPGPCPVVEPARPAARHLVAAAAPDRGEPVLVRVAVATGAPSARFAAARPVALAARDLAVAGPQRKPGLIVIEGRGFPGPVDGVTLLAVVPGKGRPVAALVALLAGTQGGGMHVPVAGPAFGREPRVIGTAGARALLVAGGAGDDAVLLLQLEAGPVMVEILAASHLPPIDDVVASALVLGVTGDAALLETGVKPLPAPDALAQGLVAGQALVIGHASAQVVAPGATPAVVQVGVGLVQLAG